ncbi:MAG: response regulator [Gammaproteobacteria bacterium]|nr:response regulator [Gammaproteobacteria bacterium]|tara:strand:+ start:290 stop:661 length:372 start_codon:yes stop_codon:yes gene_type:complete
MDQNAKILIVDDMQTMRRLLRSALNDLGYTNVVDADGGASALSLLESGDFSLLITDWNMPGMEGIDLLKAVRANDKLKSLPVLMVTAEAKKEQILEAAEAGVNGYVVKPFQPAQLKDKLDRVG